MAPPRVVAALCGLLVAVTWLLAHGTTAVEAAGHANAVQLSPSVLLMGYFDWKLFEGRDGRKWSRCLDMVWRARRYSSGNRLNFVPTHHWLPESDGFGVSQFCYMPSGGPCTPWTPPLLGEFKESMTLCLAEALKQGFIPYVRPHLDDGLNRGVWRNGLLFNPTLKYGGYSYADVMTMPLAQAMHDALALAAAAGNLTAAPDKARPVVYMGLQGEMSATVMRYTSAWASLIPAIRTTVGASLADVKVGIGLNFNALDATEKHDADGAGGAGGWLGALIGSGSRGGLRTAIPAIDAVGVTDLLSSKLDFVGVSAYAPYSGAGFGTNEFENSAFNVADSLRGLGVAVDLPRLAASGALELHYSEFGIGGGMNGNGAIAPSADVCAQQPWAGITGAYTGAADPWQRSDLGAFRITFYSRALDWLSSPASAHTHRICEVFVWGMSSWDLFGVYPDSSNAQGSYRGEDVVRRAARHNTGIIAAQVCARAPGSKCAAFAKAQAACLADDSGAACLTSPAVSRRRKL